MFPSTEKTGTRHGNAPQNFILRQNHNPEVVDWSWLCVSDSQTCVYCFTCRLMCVDTTKCAHFLIRKGICHWKHAHERRRSHEHSMKHTDATITFSRGWRIDTVLARDVEAAISSTASASTNKKTRTRPLTYKTGKLHDDLAFYEERHGC